MNQVPQIISQSKLEETDYSAIKISMLALLGIAASAFAWYEFGQFLLTYNYAFFWFGMASLTVFLVTNILVTFFVKHFAIIWGILFVESFAPIAVFASELGDNLSLALLAGCVILFLATLAGVRRGGQYLKNSVKMKFFPVARAITPKLVTGVLAFASILFYVQYFEWGKFDEAMARRLTYEAVRGAEPMVNIWFGNFSGTQTMGALLRDITITQIEASPYVSISGVPFDLREGLNQLPAEVRERIIRTFSDELEKTLEAKIGPIDSQAYVRDVAFDVARNYINQLPANVVEGGKVALAIIVFLTLRGVAFLLSWIVNLIAFLIFKFLIAANIGGISFEMRSREFTYLP